MARHRVESGRRFAARVDFAVLRRFGGFAGLPIISAFAPLVFLPLVARNSPTDVWVAIGVGQSVGQIVGMVGNLGWSLTGPSRIAGEQLSTAAAAYFESTAQRSAWFVPIGLGGSIATALTLDGSRAVGIGVTLGTAFVSMRSDWFFIGRGEPRSIALYEVAPRLVALGAGSLVYSETHEALLYPGSLILGSACSSLLVRRRIRSICGRPSEPYLRRARVSRTTLTAVAADVSGSLYTAGAVALVGMASTVGATASYSSGDRVLKWSFMGVVALCQAMQGWVLEARGRQRLRRLRVGLLAHAVLGVSGLVVMAVVGHELTSILFGPRVATGRIASVGFGVAIGTLALAQGVSKLVLVPSDRVRIVLLANAIGSAVGVTGLLLGARWDGASGAALALALSQSLVLSVLCAGAVRAVRDLRLSSESLTPPVASEIGSLAEFEVAMPGTLKDAPPPA